MQSKKAAVGVVHMFSLLCSSLNVSVTIFCSYKSVKSTMCVRFGLNLSTNPIKRDGKANNRMVNRDIFFSLTERWAECRKHTCTTVVNILPALCGPSLLLGLPTHH